MSNQTSTRRHFLKGLGLLTGAFATGTTAVKSFAHDGASNEESSSGMSCSHWESWHTAIIADASKGPGKIVYYVNYTGVYSTGNKRFPVKSQTLPQKSAAQAWAELNNAQALFQQSCA